MQIADLDRRVTFENPTKTANNYGEETLDWSTYKTVWAKIDWKGGGENEESEKLTATSKVVFHVRNIDLANLTTETRINYDSKYYYVRAINEIGREQFFEIMTEQKD